MSSGIGGIHHVTAIAGDPQRNIDFYAGVLGLRLVKRTVNFDDPGSWHFYYGDETGTPGTILTFFAWPGAPRGRHGPGQLTVTSFSIAPESMAWWVDRLTAAGVEPKGPYSRFQEEVLDFADQDGLRLELVADAGADLRPGWAGGPVPPEHALRGFHGVTLTVEGCERTAELLHGHMGFAEGPSTGGRFRFTIGEGTALARVDVLCQPDGRPGTMGAGTVHHVAWRVADDASQVAWRARLADRGLNLTPVLDRQYFHSFYFREPGGVLFEIATDAPGFLVDESLEELGSRLRLPPWLEGRRDSIERALPPAGPPFCSGARGLGMARSDPSGS